MITKYIHYQYGIIHKKTTMHICVTATNVWFSQNYTSKMHRLLAIEMPKFS